METSGKKHYSQCKELFKGPEAAACPEWLKYSKEARVAGIE